jgi:uncharacterized protein
MRFIMRWSVISIMLFSAGLAFAADGAHDYPINPVPFTAVKINDGFWAPRMETNRTVTIPFDFKKCEETSRIANFAVAGGLQQGEHIGIFFNDSDVFKVMEGAAFSLSLHPDSRLDAYLDDLIYKVAAAQEDDGYLYTVRTINPEKVTNSSGKERWSNVKDGHELYNVGHMYEAAAAHYLATGKRTLLDVAIKNADLIDCVFGPGKKHDAPGHEEIEIGLSKLYRVTGDEKYLELAKFFLDQRGNEKDRKIYGAYCQDHKLVVNQKEAVGHAVRAGYLYSGMADVAALTGDPDYIKAIDRIWENVVNKKIYLTGAIGARHQGEAFGENYELPNKTAYNETCASIANAMWNHRLFLLHGDSKYIDVLERILYNGFLSGVSLDGDAFFYPNPLECDGEYKFNQGDLLRKPWFGCSCCPSNVVRFMPSIPGFVYARVNDSIYVNLYTCASGAIELDDNLVNLTQETNYPWDGLINISVDPQVSSEFTVCLRIPGWVRNKPMPGDLYRYANDDDADITLTVNGRLVPIELDKGYVRIKRQWSEGDVIKLDIPMPIRRVLCRDEVKDNVGKAAIERGPIVYCAEWIDNGGNVFDLSLPDETELNARFYPYLLDGVTAIRGKAIATYKQDGETVKKQQPLMLIPYYAWAHRGAGQMRVWLPRG